MGRTKHTPTTKQRPAIYFRVPQPVYDRLAELAKREGVTVSEATRMVLRDALKREAA
jgi:macrodomain Ter protein organizer (MatP/YcbG family)